MKRIFPEMTDRPEKGMFLPVVTYGFFAYIILPVLVAILGLDVWDDFVTTSWLELVYHLINAGMAALMFKGYLGESFFNVQTDTKGFAKIVALATFVMLSWALVLFLNYGIEIRDAFPINELSITVTSGLMVQELPVWGTMLHTLAAPFAIAGLFYATGFAPLCCYKPWLGYLIIPIILVIPGLLDINWRGNAELVMRMYFLRLPIHLVACWAYQKADTIWAPIACLAIFNLVTSILCMLPL